MEIKQSFSTSEVATYCHVTADTIRKWAEAGRIRVFKTPGGHRRIRREDLLHFLRQNRIPVHPDLEDAGARILVVDSDPSVGESVLQFLERARTRCVVKIATGPFDAGHLMATFQPDVVLLALGQQAFDGLEVCQRIREKPEYSPSRLIAMVDAPAESLVSRARAAGVEAELSKPLSPDELRNTLVRVGVETD